MEKPVEYHNKKEQPQSDMQVRNQNMGVQAEEVNEQKNTWVF